MKNSFENLTPSAEEILPMLGKREKLKPSEVVTEKDSVYRYLPDGRTQRFKTATGQLDEIQDTLTFIPPYELVKEQGPKLYPDVFAGIENAAQYEQLILEYSQLSGRTIRVIDENSRELATAAEVEKALKVFLAFIDSSNPKNNFTLPVSKEPKVGYQTFDTRVFKGKNGEKLRERHIGNKVVEIKYVSS